MLLSVAPISQVQPLGRGLPATYRYLHSSPARFASSTQSPKKQITVRTGNSSTRQWGELSGGEKTVRAASTGASAATIIVGLLVTGAVFTVFYLEVMAPDSATNWFNRAHDRVKNDPDCVRLLGGGRIKAYGEPTSNRWARNRPIAHSVTTDRTGAEHLRIHFNVEGTLDKGVVSVHLIKKAGHSDYEYKYLYLDIAGNRIYLENADKQGGTGSKARGFMGVKWGW
ncbi:TIM21-domain-containing protein [Geopyxis carbonaria]|nr:TIM21-domain-containing protein [Geopyxis carbonaria]